MQIEPSFDPHLMPVAHGLTRLDKGEHLSSTPKLPTTIPLIEKPACSFAGPR